ncbi:MAG: hypothetical protein DDT21_01881 [Syntrophomonadaceae bacterium]|nr:hypothetical protein [Bacillota bacterium]
MANAGRPPLGNKKMVRRFFTLRPDQAEWLAQQPNQSAVVRKALDIVIAESPERLAAQAEIKAMLAE